MTFSCYLIGADTLLLECGNLLLDRGHQIRGVVTAADKVKDWATEKGVPVIELDRSYPEALRGQDFDYLFAITHLAIIPDDLLSVPKKGAINFHDGPLPRYAGLNTPAWALMNQEPEYGITWHFMTAGVDEGDILEQQLFPINANETSLTLNTRNFQVAMETFGGLIDKLAQGTEQRKSQDVAQRSYFGKHQRPARGALLDWQRPAAELEALVRALDFGGYDNPLAMPKLWLEGRILGVKAAESILSEAGQGEPGTITDAGGAVSVATAEGQLVLTELCALDGTALEGSVAEQLGVQVGDRLPSAPAEMLAAIEQWQELLAKSEDFWGRRLERLDPAEVVMAQPHADAGPWGEAEIPYPEVDAPPAALVLAAVGLYLGRTSGKHEFALSYVGKKQTTLSTELRGLVAPCVPLMFTWSGDTSVAAALTAAGEELARVDSKGGYWRELVARRSTLSSRTQLAMGAISPVVISDAASQALPPGSVLAFEVGASSLKLRYLKEAFAGREEALIEQVSTTLRNLAADRDRTCGQVPLVSDEAARRVLVEWNATGRQVDEGSCIHSLFERQAQKTPDRLAVASMGRELTFAELNRRANGLAKALVDKGVGPDQLVGVMVERSVELLVATLGVMKAGGAYVPLDPAYPAERIKYMLEDSGARLLVTQSDLLRAKPANVETILVDQSGEQAENVSGGAQSSNLAYVIYTSGSTGLPKGVMVEHRNVVNFFEGMDDVIERSDDSIWLSVTSLSFDISVLELFWTLSRGVSIVLHRDQAKSDKPALEAGKAIDFSLFLWGADDKVSANKYELMLHAGKFGDDNGFSAVWTPERHFHAFGGPYPNPSVTGAALASITKNLQIRAGSCVVPLHHPVRVAEEWAVVDNISQGRVGVSFASGWQPDDFLLKPENYAENKRKMVEAIEQVRKLWRGEAMTFVNGMGKEVSIVTQPRPIQKELPYWVTTAGNPETFRIAGESGANLLTHLLGQSLEELESKIAVYREAREKAGYGGDTGIVSLMLHTYVGESEQIVKERVRQPMKDYLRSSVNLIKGFAWAFPAFKKPKKGGGEELDIGGLTDEDLDTILEFAFERYYETSGLFGTADKCVETVAKVQAIGVDDIACLIDFGVPTVEVKEGLEHLAKLRRLVDEKLAATDTATPAGDYSLPGLCSSYAMTHMQCTPALMRMAMMDDKAKSALTRIPHLMLGGEALPIDMARELAGRSQGTLTNMYGPTETTIWSSTHRFEPNPSSVPIGRPIVNTQLYVLDCERMPVPIGVPGELYIGGKGVVRGYHERPELTRERFVPDPFAGGDARMYRTGDLVRHRGDGVLEFLGRTDHQIKLRGYRIELGEIEARLTQQEGVNEGVVVAREDTPGDQRLVAYYTGKADADTLRAALRERLPEFMVPAAFCQLPRLPHTPNGKIDRKALPAPDTQRTRTDEAAIAPESELEGTVVGLWQEVLGVDEVGVTDNFFDLGGHSLLVVRLHQLLKKALNPDIPMTALYRFPTIRTFVQNLNDGDSSEAAKQAKDRGQMRREQMARRRGARMRAR